MKKRVNQSTALAFAFFGLAGCSLVNYTSSESYTIEGELTANTGIEFWTRYEAVDASASACTYTGFSSGSREVRKAGDSIEVKAQPNAQHYKITIPRYIVKKGCKTAFVSARVVPIQKRDGIEYSTTSLGFSSVSIENAYKNQRRSVLNCAYAFEIKPARGHPDTDINKFLDCKIATQPLVMPERLALNTFILNINVTDEEKPAVATSWVKIAQGWKPCKGSIGDMAGFCGDIPNFRTFKHKGKTCTVYPNCTE